METGTFPNEEVQKYVGQYFVTVRYEQAKDAAQFTKYSVFATPSFFVYDTEGDQVYRMVGYFSPEDFITQIVSALQITSKL